MSFFYLVYYFSIYLLFFLFFFFNHTPTTEIYTLSLHDALPICFYSSDGCFRFNAYAVFVFGNTANGDTVEGQQFAVLVFEIDHHIVVADPVVAVFDHLDIEGGINVVGGDLMTAGRPVIVARYRHAFSVFRWGNDADDAVVVPIEIALLNGHDPFIDIGIDVRHLCYIVVHTEFVLEVEGEGAFYRSVLLLVRA